MRKMEIMKINMSMNSIVMLQKQSRIKDEELPEVVHSF